MEVVEASHKQGVCGGGGRHAPRQRPPSRPHPPLPLPRSMVEVVEASRKVYAAVVDGKLAVKLGPGAWTPEGMQLGGREPRLAASGFQ